MLIIQCYIIQTIINNGWKKAAPYHTISMLRLIPMLYKKVNSIQIISEHVQNISHVLKNGYNYHLQEIFATLWRVQNCNLSISM